MGWGRPFLFAVEALDNTVEPRYCIAIGYEMASRYEGDEHFGGNSQPAPYSKTGRL